MCNSVTMKNSNTIIVDHTYEHHIGEECLVETEDDCEIYGTIKAIFKDSLLMDTRSIGDILIKYNVINDVVNWDKYSDKHELY